MILNMEIKILKNIYIFSLLIFFISSHALFGQSFTTQRDDGTEYEYTSITMEQFNRIRNANEQNAVSVYIDFWDEVQTRYDRVIKGTRPRFSGDIYQIIKQNPPNPGEIVFLRYRNGVKSYMNIIFYNRVYSDTILLAYNRNEYIRLYNLYSNMVKNSR
jgi:hypothetical protein